MKIKLHYPTKPYKINQRFGENLNGFYKKLGMKGHNGMDLYAPDGWIVRASHCGTVLFTGYDGSGGLGVTMISTDKKYKTIYWHAKENSILVTPDQKVKTGDVLMLADNTGMSTGSHLHFGLKKVKWNKSKQKYYTVNYNNGYWGGIDPEQYWSGNYAEDIATLRAKIKTMQIKLIGLLKKLLTLYRK